MQDLKGFIADTVQVVLWALLVAAAFGLGLRYRSSKSKTGWTLYKLITAAIICQALYMSSWAVHNDAVRSVGLGKLTDTLYRVYIPLKWLATSSFMGLLLLLAAGYCITRSDLGDYRAHVLGLPVLLFVTGVVTDYVNFQVLDASSDQLDLFELAGWEQGLWFVCTVVNLAAFAFWVVYIFEIIQAEVDALRAQQELNLVRNAAPTATVLPFPGARDSSAAAPAGPAPLSSSHAGPPPGLDPAWAEAAAEEGVVAYKNLLGPGQNMSHVPGADVEGGEITTVADQVNFEIKQRMYKRFSTGFGIFVVAYTCVTLSPVFVIDIVQDVITFFQFVVTYSYLAALLWMFRPEEDSPYLLMGADIDHLDTSLGVEADEDAVEYPTSSSGGGGASGGPRGCPSTGGRAVEMTGHSGSPAGGHNSSLLGTKPGALSATAGDSKGGGRDQGGSRQQGGSSSSSNGLLPLSSSARDLRSNPAGVGTAAGSALVGDLPLTLPAIRTSLGGGRPEAAAAGQQQQQQQQPALWSLGDEDELHEIKLHNLSPQKRD